MYLCKCREMVKLTCTRTCKTFETFREKDDVRKEYSNRNTSMMDFIRCFLVKGGNFWEVQDHFTSIL